MPGRQNDMAEKQAFPSLETDPQVIADGGDIGDPTALMPEWEKGEG
jgi:hypothetical protein